MEEPSSTSKGANGEATEIGKVRGWKGPLAGSPEPLPSGEKSTGDQAFYIQPSYFISIEMNNREGLR
jgi:hypothetical protein